MEKRASFYALEWSNLGAGLGVARGRGAVSFALPSALMQFELM